MLIAFWTIHTYVDVFLNCVCWHIFERIMTYYFNMSVDLFLNLFCGHILNYEFVWTNLRTLFVLTYFWTSYICMTYVYIFLNYKTVDIFSTMSVHIFLNYVGFHITNLCSHFLNYVCIPYKWINFNKSSTASTVQLRYCTVYIYYSTKKHED